MATLASAAVSNATIPLPLDLPLYKVLTSARATSPASRNKSFNSLQPTLNGRFPTNNCEPLSLGGPLKPPPGGPPGGGPLPR